MVAEPYLDPISLVQIRHRRYIPEALRIAVASYNPKTLLGLTVKRSLLHLPPELCQELLDAIQRSVVMESSLSIVRINGGNTDRPFGTIDDFGIVSRKVITDAGVAYLVDDWDAGASDINLMDFHGIGTGTTAEAAGDTALVTESTTALNPDSTRATGTNSQPAANQFRTVGTLTADAAIAATEHGIFNQAATGGGTLWDRSVFTVVNLASADSLQATYTCTASSGG